MESEEVLILGVDNNIDCLCLGRNKVDKGKTAADPTRRRIKKSAKSDGQSGENFLVILDGAESEDDYIEMYDGGGEGAAAKGEAGGAVAKAGRRRDGNKRRKTRNELGVSSSPPEKKLKSDCLLDTSISVIEEKSSSTSTGGLTEFDSRLDSIHGRTGSWDIAVSTQNLERDHVVPIRDPVFSSVDSTSVSTAQHKDSPLSSSNETTHDINTVSTSSKKQDQNPQRTPTCWTNCPSCPPNQKRKYHLIDVAYNSAEWFVVSSPLVNAGFSVNRVQRIQNESLWQRLCYEKQLMLRERQDVNEQLLYHTSRSTVAIICEEGLDLRLSMNGSFGCGIYFSDNPLKCNSYWRGAVSRYMFCCRVLLGEIKVYPKGRSERLRREPEKPNPKTGENKFYDSVKGNLSGENEFVVYNAYRVMPEYVLHYMMESPGPPPDINLLKASHLAAPAGRICNSLMPFSNLLSPIVRRNPVVKKKTKRTRKA